MYGFLRIDVGTGVGETGDSTPPPPPPNNLLFCSEYLPGNRLQPNIFLARSEYNIIFFLLFLSLLAFYSEIPYDVCACMHACMYILHTPTPQLLKLPPPPLNIEKLPTSK